MVFRLMPEPAAPRPGTNFSGWRIVLFAAIGLAMTGPSQTPAVSVFIDPMMQTLELTRSQVSTAYLIGTLAGAFALPRFGRLIDDRGPRVAMALVGAVSGVLLVAMSGVTGLVTLVLGFTGIRLAGKGALSLVATTAVAPWFTRRRGFAIGVTTAVGSACMSLIPVFTRAVVLPAVDWRGAWVVLGVAVSLVVVPIAMRGMIDRPSDVGQEPDGDAPLKAKKASAADPEAAKVSFTRAEALRTPMFWAMAGAVATTGMIGTGLMFHQIDLLGGQGLTPIEAAANFIPQTAAALTVTLLVGGMIDRLSSRWVLAMAMGMLAIAMVMVPFITPGAVAITYGIVLGSAGAAVRTLEAASFPKLFGLRHIGSIRGFVTTISVAATAFGPLALSFGLDLTGSYAQVLWVLLALPMGVTLLGFTAKVPVRPWR